VSDVFHAHGRDDAVLRGIALQVLLGLHHAHAQGAIDRHLCQVKADARLAVDGIGFFHILEVGHRIVGAAFAAARK